MSEPNQPQGPFFGLERIYLKDVSYEAPGAPQIFLEQQAPEIGVQLGIEHRPLNAEQGLYDAVLTVTVSAKRGDKNVFLAEVQQAGVFRIKGVADEALQQALEIACPHVLLPFAREAVNDLVCKGGFPQLLINPINFEALYAQKQAAIKQPVGGQA